MMRTRRQSWSPWMFTLVGVVVIGGVLVVLSMGSSSELASADSTVKGKTVNGISCLTEEQLAVHTHAHLAVFVDAEERGIPADIGIVPDVGCLYWLHTHTPDGVIHVESPEERTFTLGDFFDIWQQPLGDNRVGPAQGRVIAYVDGERFDGDPREIPLEEHTLVQLDVGKDVKPKQFTFPTGL
jgi:hypothetical protein